MLLLKREVAALKVERQRKTDISAELKREMQKDPIAVLKELEKILKN
jgi:hypothetical protein